MNNIRKQFYVINLTFPKFLHRSVFYYFYKVESSYYIWGPHLGNKKKKINSNTLYNNSWRFRFWFEKKTPISQGEIIVKLNALPTSYCIKEL